MGTRIYFVSSNYEYSEAPYNKLCYWDEATGEIHSVATNITWDLGTGYIAKEATGDFVVFGPRWSHYVPADVNIDYGDYWDDPTGTSDEFDLTSDVVLYRVDKDLQTSTPLVTDLINQGREDEGWYSNSLYNILSDYNDEHKYPFVMPDGNILIVGRRFTPYATNDTAQGKMLHIYTPAGELVSRKVSYYGWDTEAEFPGYGTMYSSGDEMGLLDAAYDATRGLVWVYDGGGLWRVNVATGALKYAPQIYPWVQTQAGWPRYQVESYIGNPNYIVQGPYPYDVQDYTAGPENNFRAPAYSWIEESDYFRSRQAIGIDVDERTGYVWALVHGYEPYGQEYAMPGDGTPLSSFPGGFGAPGEEWQLLCVDFDKCFYTFDRPNMWPNTPDGVAMYQHAFGPHSAPPQKDADVKTIVLTKGSQHVALPAGDPARPGFDLMRDSSYTLLTGDIPELNGSDTPTTGVNLAAGQTLTVHYEYTGTAPSDFALSITTNRTDAFAIEAKVNGISMGVIDTAHSERTDFPRLSFYSSEMQGGTYKATVTTRADLLAALTAGPITVTLTVVSGSAFVQQVSPFVNFWVPRAAGSGGSWDFLDFHISRDEPGIGYYTVEVPHFDPETIRWTMVYAAYRINLDTGVSTEVFRDLRREKPDPSYDDGQPTDLNRLGMFQVLDVPELAIPFGPNLLANLLDTGQRFL